MSGNKTIVVVGGGISGITSAIEAAEVGHDVVLLERRPYLGGRVMQMYKYFPKLCHPACGLEINFRRMKQNPNISFYTLAEVEDIKRSNGGYEVDVTLYPRYVNENCTCCGKCGEVCSQEIPNPFNHGMDTIKAAYLPHLNAFPLRYTIDPGVIGTEDGAKCRAACEYQAVDLEMKMEKITLKAGSLIWATGWEPYDARKIEPYGFGRYSNVITNVMMERLAAVEGPTGGRIVRPSDGKEAKKVAFVQCAGSRDENHLPYCSRVCCLASLKQATYVREQYPDSQVTMFYIDIRAQDRLEDFYTKVEEDDGVTLVRSKVAGITEDGESKDLLLQGEDTSIGNKYEERFDMVVLAVGMVPATSGTKVPGDSALSYDDYGFITSNSQRNGIYAAGCVKAPTEVSAAVQDATAASLYAIQSLTRGK